jgi:hypothetical protein
MRRSSSSSTCWASRPLRLAGVAAVLIAAALAGCGASGGTLLASRHGLSGSSPAERRLQRADLAIAARGLLAVEPTVRQEIAASRAAWPTVVHGLPAVASPTARLAIARAAVVARRIATPLYISFAGQLTGAAATIAGSELSYEELTQRGWTLTGVAADYGARAATGSGSLAAAGFLRVNAALYIGCVYDAHHNLGAIGEDLRRAYAQLGGAAAFGAMLRPARVEALARFYSPANAGLAPEPAASAIGS